MILIGFHKEYSYVYRALRSVSRLIREKFSGTENQSFTEETFFAIELQRSEIYQIKKSKYIEESYAASKNLIKKMFDTAIKLNKKFYIILAPDEIQVNRLLQSKSIV